MADGSLKRRAATSIGWSMLRFGGDQLFNFLVYATLARLLVPAQFGTFVLALGIAEVGKVIAQGGLVSVLYRHKTVTAEIADTIFWTNVATGLAVALLSFVFRHPLAIALGSPGAADVIGVIGFAVPIAAAGGVHMARNLREFGHRALAIRSLFAGIIGDGLAIWAAFAGWGVWALVVQRLVNETIGTLIAWYSFRWMPGRHWSWRTLKTQLALGSSITVSQLLLVGLGRVQDIIISRMIGLAQVGVYRTAWKSIDVISQGVIVPFAGVAAPTLLKLVDDRNAFRRAYLRLIGTSALVSFPAIVGVGAVADQLVPLLYGPQWHASVPIAEILSLLVLPFSLNFFGDPGLTVLGKSKVIAQLAVVQLLLTIAMCMAAAPYGLVAFTIAYVARAYITMALQLFLFQREAKVSAFEILGAVMPPLLASIAMAGVLYAVRWLLPMEFGLGIAERLARAAAFMGLGAVVYSGSISLLIGRERRREIIAQLLRITKRA